MSIFTVYENNNFSKLFFFTFYIFIWGSLDTNFENSLKLLDEFSSRNIILFLRSTFFPFLLFFLSLFFFFNKPINIKNIKKKNYINYISYLFFIFLLIQLISHLVSDNEIIFTYYFFLSIFLLIYFNFAYFNNLLNVSFYISLIFLICLFVFFGFLSLKHFLTNGDLHLYGTFPSVYKSILTVSTNSIRSSGLARTTMLIYIPLFIYLLVSPISKSKFLFIFLLTFILLLTQSRLTNLYWLLFIFLSSYWYLRKNKIKEFIKKIFILIIIPFLITGGVISIKYYLMSSEIILVNASNDFIGLNKEKLFKNIIRVEDESNKKLGILQDNKIIKQKEKKKVVIIRQVDPSTYSSGRVEYWGQILDSNDRFFFGNGFLGDRFLIKNNASNIAFYTFASGGLIALFILMTIIFRCVFICYDLMFIKKIHFNKNNIILISSVFYIAFLTFRGIGENSYAVFSIDMIIFLQSLFIVEISRRKLF